MIPLPLGSDTEVELVGDLVACNDKESDTRTDFQIRSHDQIVDQTVVAIGAIGVVMRLGGHRTSLECRLGLSSRGIAEYELNHIRTLGNEIIARGQCTQHNGIEIGHDIGASVALEGSGEEAGVGLHNIRGTDRPRQASFAIGIQLERFVDKIVEVARLIGRFGVFDRTDYLLLRAHLVGHRESGSAERNCVGDDNLSVVVCISLEGSQVEIPDIAGLIDGIIQQIFDGTILLAGPQVADDAVGTTLIVLINNLLHTECTRVISLFDNIEFRLGEISLDEFGIVSIGETDAVTVLVLFQRIDNSLVRIRQINLGER